MSHPQPDPDDQPIFSARDLLESLRARGRLPKVAAPEAIVLTFQRTALDHARRKWPGLRFTAYQAELHFPLRARGRIGFIGNFGIGSPAVAALVEQLAAFGVRRFVAVGLAGGLQAEMRPGDLIVCDRAYRDEGLSRHYLPPSDWIEADRGLVAGLASALESAGARTGSSWTTDAPFRELRRDVARHQREGVLTVEMEAAALFAVASALGISAGAVFTISDVLAGGTWSPGQEARPMERGLRTLIEAAYAFLLRSGGS